MLQTANWGVAWRYTGLVCVFLTFILFTELPHCLEGHEISPSLNNCSDPGRAFENSFALSLLHRPPPPLSFVRFQKNLLKMDQMFSRCETFKHLVPKALFYRSKFAGYRVCSDGTGQRAVFLTAFRFWEGAGMKVFHWTRTAAHFITFGTFHKERIIFT